ncbi:exopolyphosphatase/guanosine-5'-triphosphate,3'-diphosphate pyrophosphatase [Pseudoduganella flava]|uniref:Exopolyphosphatase/guanosine-5'-triphosphate, 3'-diphosphate pyrophosphatase n=1 Tax=Pseudoduganella flava TaxID=871742 RepID=A0A562PD42_9BURK|nr:Ppx/GppA phosphatase family protein [Pseudoduganella flava]QGZ42193.1 Ppx/GppA family phosphatase [Pseudoduganella flava]TWI42422.1 exopolyphosphatase/guanosine-5'-triphosphate,3'-diphosphate pyrophosphatase [Pseudoduganella flava]
MYAAVDLGSNSFRLSIGKHDGDTIRVAKSMREPIRLAAGLDAAGNLTEAAQQRALACLKSFAALLAAYQLDAVRVVATSTMRQARNIAAFLPLAEQAIGYPIEIISGEEEGRLIYMGVANALAQPAERRLVVDIGGGSTELILGRGPDIERVESFSVGSVKQSLSFFIGGYVDAPSFEAAILSARSHFEDGAPPYMPQYWKRAYGSSGTIRAIAEAIEKNGLGKGITPDSLAALQQRFIAFGHVSKIDMPGLRPDRASTVIGGLAILIGVMHELDIDEIFPIEAGLRIGVMWDLYLREMRRDRREQSVRDFARKFHVDEARAARVADDALALLEQLKPASEATPRLLYWSALLHEVGQAISQTGHHKHAAYMVENADLPGFTTREQRMMSRLLMAQKGNLRKVGEFLADTDFARAVVALRLAIVFMHARVTADEVQPKLRMKNRIELELRREWVAGHPTLSYWIEKEQEQWDEVGVDLSVRTST